MQPRQMPINQELESELCFDTERGHNSHNCLFVLISLLFISSVLGINADPKTEKCIFVRNDTHTSTAYYLRRSPHVRVPAHRQWGNKRSRPKSMIREFSSGRRCWMGNVQGDVGGPLYVNGVQVGITIWDYAFVV
ncbi:hypothetical protein OUZ56_019434 [Daphnia magna]|uniref:Peptidase S1 domain-containing protein n=1 Tax=Daphnia magna TaxID=35525 RepID=A0ABQ9ZBL1_9CRUS|nr:hypothetical protein OUZ56_019434 [Daphnia magna]